MKQNNRRFKLGIVFCALINVSYFWSLAGGKDIVWFTEYSKSMTMWFGIIVGCLTVTDVAYHIKEALLNKKKEI